MTENIAYRESRLRSILKACSWRFVATCATFIIAYLVTNETTFAFTIAGVEIFAKMIIYYFHERAWQLIPRGSIRKLVKKNRHNKAIDSNNK